LSDPGPLWLPLIEHENATYGDLIVLPLEETKTIAKTIKPLEFFKSLLKQERRWKFVSKIDDDSYLDVNAFDKQFLAMWLDMEAHFKGEVRINRTMIGKKVNQHGLDYAGGQFYTMSWDLLELLARLYTNNPTDKYDEDALNGILLKDAGVEWQLIELDGTMAFDLVPHGSSPLAKDGEDLTGWSHAVGPNAINPHKIKDDEMYLKVASLWDEAGLHLDRTFS